MWEPWGSCKQPAMSARNTLTVPLALELRAFAGRLASCRYANVREVGHAAPRLGKRNSIDLRIARERTAQSSGADR